MKTNSQVLWRSFLLTFSLTGLIAALCGQVLLARKNLRVCIFLTLWLIIPLILFFQLRTLVPRFLVVALGPVIIAQCYLFAHLMNHRRLRFIVLTVYGIIIIKIFLYISPILLYRHTHADLPDFARWVAQKTEPNAVIMVSEERLFMHYYANRKAIDRPVVNHDLTDEELQKYKQTIEDLLSQGIPVYATWPGLFVYDPSERFSQFMMENFTIISIGKNWYEDWHRDILKQQVYFFDLFKILKKTEKEN